MTELIIIVMLLIIIYILCSISYTAGQRKGRKQAQQYHFINRLLGNKGLHDA
jgi:hypothetical protein